MEAVQVKFVVEKMAVEMFEVIVTEIVEVELLVEVEVMAEFNVRECRWCGQDC